MGVSKQELISIAECAKRLGLTVRQVQRLRVDGLPMQGDRVVWPAARIWRDERLIERGRQQAVPTDAKEAKNRKTAAEAELAELDVAQRRGELVPLAEAEREWANVLGGLRARILAMPGKYAPRLGLPIAQAQRHLEDISRELLAELADTADDIPGDDADDSTDPS